MEGEEVGSSDEEEDLVAVKVSPCSCSTFKQFISCHFTFTAFLFFSKQYHTLATYDGPT